MDDPIFNETFPESFNGNRKGDAALKGSGRSAAEALKLGLWSEAVSKGKGKGKKRKIKVVAKAVAALTLIGMILWSCSTIYIG